MIIIVGTSRSGTSFLLYWYKNNNPDFIVLKPNNWKKYDIPGEDDWDGHGEFFGPHNFPNKNYDEETLNRINLLPDKTIFKVLTYPASPIIWEFIRNKKLILVERKDTLEQFISYGLAKSTRKWISWAPNFNKLDTIVPIEYKQEWFDELAYELTNYTNKKLNYFTNIDKIIYYEDLHLFKQNGKLPCKQNSGTNEEKLNFFSNQTEFLDWYTDFIK